MKKISLTNDYTALVDDEDYVRIAIYQWSYDIPSKRAVAISNNRTIHMARAVLNIGQGDPRRVEHKSGDRLDNRKENLVVYARHRHSDRVMANSLLLAAWQRPKSCRELLTETTKKRRPRHLQ